MLIIFTSKNGFGDEQVDLQASQLLFLLFNSLVDDSSRSVYIAAILLPICKVAENKPLDSNIVVFLGKAVTHIARNFPQLFKDNIATLSEFSRNLLMSIMRAAIQSMEQSGAAMSNDTQNNNSSGGLKIKKIDISGYKKSTPNETNNINNNSSTKPTKIAVSDVSTSSNDDNNSVQL
jgi:hypothetical protein